MKHFVRAFWQKGIHAVMGFLMWSSVAFAAAGAHLSFTTTLAGLPGQVFFRNTDAWQTGFGRLEGDAVINSEPVQVELLAALEYENGTGSFTGFITLNWPSGDALVMRYVGGAVRDAGGNTTVTGALTVLGGTGSYARSTGSGQVHGFRSGQLGGPVHYDVVIDLGRLRRSAVNEVGFDGGAGDEVRGHDSDAKGRQRGIVLEVGLSGVPEQQFFRHIGPKGTLEYGGSRQLGTADWFGTPMLVELLGVIENREGEGSFIGFIHLELPDGSVALCRFFGKTQRGGGGSTVIRGELEAFYGTGALASLRGDGRVMAIGNGVPGSPLRAKITLPIP